MKRNTVVVLSLVPVCYLGRLDSGPLQGVTRLTNATLYTAVGARRVAREYPGAHTMLAVV